MKNQGLICIVLLILGGIANSCKQQEILSGFEEFNSRNLSLAEAKAFFEENIASPVGSNGHRASSGIRNRASSGGHVHDENCEHNQEKRPMWDGFGYRELSSGNQAVMVPLHREGTYVQISEDRMVKYGFLNYMMMYKDSTNSIVTEWVQLKPSLKWFDATTTREC